MVNPYNLRSRGAEAGRNGGGGAAGGGGWGAAAIKKRSTTTEVQTGRSGAGAAPRRRGTAEPIATTGKRPQKPTAPKKEEKEQRRSSPKRLMDAKIGSTTTNGGGGGAGPSGGVSRARDQRMDEVTGAGARFASKQKGKGGNRRQHNTAEPLPKSPPIASRLRRRSVEPDRLIKINQLGTDSEEADENRKVHFNPKVHMRPIPPKGYIDPVNRYKI